MTKWFALPGDDDFEGDFMDENIRERSADSENEDSDIEHGIKIEGTGEMEITKFLFGSNSETYSDDESGKEEIYDNFNAAGEEVNPRNKRKIHRNN